MSTPLPVGGIKRSAPSSPANPVTKAPLPRLFVTSDEDGGVHFVLYSPVDLVQSERVYALLLAHNALTSTMPGGFIYPSLVTDALINAAQTAAIDDETFADFPLSIEGRRGRIPSADAAAQELLTLTTPGEWTCTRGRAEFGPTASTLWYHSWC